MTQPVAIQSYCYRGFKALPAFIEQLRSTGVAATEICGVHASFNDPATFGSTIEPFQKAGVQIVAIGVEKLTGDLVKDAPRFEFCKAAGVRNMSVTFDPGIMDNQFAAMKNVEKLADQYDLKLGIHNHGGYDWLGNIPMLKYIFDRTSPRIGLHLDTAWAIDAKHNPVQMVEQFAPRMMGVHVKDFVYSPKREPKDVIIGEGNLDLPKFMQTLKQINFSGPLVIEYEGDVENPVPALKQCVAALNKLV
ncbi:MAG TPA: sugar phosphate isomerase/epimerase family protein [Tepidisphaeraceae bacterium]|nr:sugar phosphate isomerase/epimerase family protein [Tepidisphaeraceae bacterium]